MPVRFEFRDMTDEEYKKEQEAFDSHGLAFGNPPEQQERFGFVAQDDGKFVGASSGLAPIFLLRIKRVLIGGMGSDHGIFGFHDLTQRKVVAFET